MMFYQAKAYHDHDIPRNAGLSVVIENELLTEGELKRHHLPVRWFRKVSANKEDVFYFFGARFVDDGEYKIIEEDLT